MTARLRTCVPECLPACMHTCPRASVPARLPVWTPPCLRDRRLARLRTCALAYPHAELPA
eukprot:1022136-Alexandrium_andersonii.AAC.1